MVNLNWTPPSNETPSKKKKSVNFFILFFILGIVLAGIVYIFVKDGLFARWQIITRVPDHTAGVIGGSPAIAYIQSADGKVLSCLVYNTDYCWVPDLISDPTISQPCDTQKIAFSLFSNTPKNISSCIMNRTVYAESFYEVFYVIDHAGNLWEWKIGGSGFEILLLPFILFVGGLGGLLFGGLVWGIKESAEKNRALSKRTPLSKAELGRRAVPWVCLLLGLIGLIFLSNQSSNELSYKNTAVSKTLLVQKAELTQQWVVEVTPRPGNLRINFSQIGCAASWTMGSPVPCYEEPDSSGLVVSKLLNPSLESNPMLGEGLSVQMNRNQKMVEGKFPTIQIQEGDHFKATIGCLEASSACNLIFEITCDTEDQNGIPLGRWSQKNDGKIETIDLNLAKLAGRKVRFNLITTDLDDSANLQNAVWFMPRIEP